jgi:hypothetical protein
MTDAAGSVSLTLVKVGFGSSAAPTELKWRVPPPKLSFAISYQIQSIEAMRFWCKTRFTSWMSQSPARMKEWHR